MTINPWLKTSVSDKYSRSHSTSSLGCSLIKHSDKIRGSKKSDFIPEI